MRFTSQASVAVLRFMFAALLAAAIIVVGAYLVVSRNAVAEATRNAQEIAAIDGRGIVGPALSDAVVSGDPAATAAFDTMIRSRVLSSRVVRTKIWGVTISGGTVTGKVVYSDAASLVGRSYPLGEDAAQAMGQNRIVADVSDLTQPENGTERGYGRLLEVYLPVQSASGKNFLFETYQVYSVVDDDQRRIWSSFFPVLVGGVLLLLAVQLPLAWGMARKLDSARREREALLNRAIDASEGERQRIARDLHDGVVQTLAGASFTLGAAAATAADPGIKAALRQGAQATRQAVTDLRTLIVEIAPPDLEGTRLEGALEDLLALVAREGVTTSLEVDGLDAVGPDAAALLYRAAQEALRNAAAHAGATHVDVTARAAAGQATVRVIDDGRGFTADEVIERQRDGHVGLAMLRGLVEDGGGRLSVSSEPGKGTTVQIEVALR